MTQQMSKRQTEIIETAIGLIAEMGIQKLTMKKIASRMGVSEPALYRHFASKMDILLAIISSFRDATGQVLAQVAQTEGPALQKIELIFGGFIARFAAQPDVAAVIFAEEIFQDDRRLAEAVHELMTHNQRVMLQMMQGGQSQGEIRDDIPAAHLMTLVVGALRLTVVRWRTSGHAFDVEAEGQQLWSSILRLLRPPQVPSAADDNENAQ